MIPWSCLSQDLLSYSSNTATTYTYNLSAYGFLCAPPPNLSRRNLRLFCIMRCMYDVCKNNNGNAHDFPTKAFLASDIGVESVIRVFMTAGARNRDNKVEGTMQGGEV